MTSEQKNRISEYRQQGYGYASIANELNISVNTVKTYCRRAGLTGNAGATQRSESYPEVDLISAAGRGNSIVPSGLNRKANSNARPECNVTVSYADKPDETAVADVLAMLMSTELNRGE